MTRGTETIRGPAKPEHQMGVRVSDSPPRRIKVLHVVAHMVMRGGIERNVYDLLRTFDRKRFRMDVCETAAHLGEMRDQMEPLGVRMHDCRLGLNYFSFTRGMRRLIRAEGYDVVHAHLFGLSGPIVHAARQAGVRVRISHYWNTSEEHSNDWKRRLYLYQIRRWVRADSTHLAACAQGVHNVFFPDLVAARDPRLRVFYPGVDLSVFSHPEDKTVIRRELGIPLDAPVVGHVGRFTQQKNHDFLVEMATRIVPQVPGVKFLLVSDGPLRPKIESLVAERGLKEHVIFTGIRRDVPRLYAAMDVFTLCSHREGFPSVVLEAAAHGLPLVCVRIPGLNEAVVPCARSLQFEPSDVETACQNVVLLLRDPNWRAVLGSHIRREVQQFSLDAKTSEMEDFYLEASAQAAIRGDPANARNLRSNAVEE